VNLYLTEEQGLNGLSQIARLLLNTYSVLNFVHWGGPILLLLKFPYSSIHELSSLTQCIGDLNFDRTEIAEFAEIRRPKD
jgi:hypothetical protein